MELTTCRKLVVAAVACIVLHRVGSWVASFATGLAGVASASVVLVVTVFCARMARTGAGNTAWFLVPTLLFTVLPTAATAWKLMTTDKGMQDWIVDLGPFTVGFVLPVALLLLVYVELRNRTGTA
jgi:hypothetical protein